MNIIREDNTVKEYIDINDLTSGLFFIKSNDPFNKTVSLLNKLEYNIVGFYYKDTSKTKPSIKIQTIKLIDNKETIELVPWSTLDEVLNTSYVTEILVREIEKAKYDMFRYILSKNLFNEYTLDEYMNYIFFYEYNIYKKFLNPILSDLDENLSELDESFFEKDDLHELNIKHLQKPSYIKLRNKNEKNINTKVFFINLSNRIYNYYLNLIKDNSVYLKLKNKNVHHLDINPIIDYVLDIIVENWNKLVENFNISMDKNIIYLTEVSKYLKIVMDNFNELYKKLTNKAESIKYNTDIMCEVPYVYFSYEDIPKKEIQSKIKDENPISLILNTCYKLIDFIDFLKDGFSIKSLSMNILENKIRIINQRLNNLSKTCTNKDRCIYNLQVTFKEKIKMQVICINNENMINLINFRENLENIKSLTEQSNGVIININLLLRLYNKIAIDNGIETLDEIKELGSKSAIISITNNEIVFLPHDPYLDNIKVTLKSGTKVLLSLTNPDLSTLSLSQLKEILKFFNKTCKDKYDLQAKIVEEIATRHG